MLTSPGGIQLMACKPSAIAPIAMSLAALSVVLITMATGLAKPQADEGAVAHVWQLLMAGQLPILGWFTLQWLRRDVRSGLPVLALQVAAFGAALLPVFLLGL